MAFVPTCPKCGSQNISIERDRRTYAAGVAEVIFSCRCGKQLFGAAAEEEIERQRQAYDTEGKRRQEQQRQREQRAQEARVRDEEIRLALARHAAEARAKEAAEAQRKKEEADRKWRERVARGGGIPEPVAPSKSRKEAAKPPPPAPIARKKTEPPRAPAVQAKAESPKDSDKCAWPTCKKKRREGSLYCSRDCSNKNARHRHAQRRKEAA